MHPTQFITIEGIEGVGKSTAVQVVQAFLSAKGYAITCTREPGGTPFAEQLRQLLLHSETETITQETELLLMFASRSQHLQQVIRPALARGEWVVCDRFTDATYAYQGGGRGMSWEMIAHLEQCVQGELRPTLTIVLDAPVDVALQRAKKRSAPDRIESQAQPFFEAVRQAYLKIAEQAPERVKIVDASVSMPEVHDQIKLILAERFHVYPKHA